MLTQWPGHSPSSSQPQVLNSDHMFTDDFQHCRSIFPIESDTALLDATNGLRNQMDQLSAQLSTRISDVKREVGNLKYDVGDVKRQAGDVTWGLDDLGRGITNS
ncbi:hypothetical protein CDV36_001210 [Fusarium kuroshium]|uniref:Uncharacterized protein n=1 Tax=Fusarium kuroshium TaxID=2010991 RepID=A0A3M2SNG2_9HYPO|nr:hypothetical protein CDV36_001210 [Fusarium kuroshium]